MGSPDWNVSMVTIHLQNILWVYCPGHAGVKGNGWADTLEGNGTLTSSLLLGAKCWGAWDTTWGHKAKDTTPFLTWRREVCYEEVLMICLKKMREGHCNLYCFKGNTGKASERQGAAQMGFSEMSAQNTPWTELNCGEKQTKHFLMIWQISREVYKHENCSFQKNCQHLHTTLQVLWQYISDLEDHSLKIL